MSRLSLGAAALVAMAAAAPSPALAALGPTELCTTTEPPRASDGDLRAVSARVEADLAGGNAAASDALISRLSIEQTSGARPSPRWLAGYCAAAGEVYRVVPGGSDVEAQAFLIAAIRLAEASGDAAIVARGAYRLGLSARASSNIAGSRGAAASDPGNRPEPASEDTEPCAWLGQARPGQIAANRLLRQALSCAASRGAKSGNPAITALAELKLAGQAIADAEKAPFAAAGLRRESQQAVSRGLAAAEAIPEAKWRALLIGRLAEIAVAAAVDPALVGRAISQMRASAPDDPATLAFAAALDGRMALAAGNAAAAAASLQRAIFLESQRAQPLRLSEWLLLLAEAQPERRRELVLQAYQALQAIRPLLPLVDPLTEESNFSARMQPIFEAAVAVQLAQDGSGSEARIASVQQIVEAYREAELQSAFGSNCVPPRDPVRPQDLRADEMLLYPILLDDRVELIFANGGGSPRFERLPQTAPVGRRAVAGLVSDLVASASLGGDEGWREASSRLYQLLIKPIESRLGAGKTLVIVPDGPLRSLPFAALLDGDGKFLVQRTRIAIAPALSYSQPGRDRGERPLNVVAAALEKPVTLPAGSFPLLAGTSDEAAAAAGKGGVILSNFKAADLRQALARGRVDVLHLATHAAFNGRSDRSFIVADDEAIPLSDLRQLISRERARGDQLELLVLSACETAVGDDQASMGLAGAAVQAGAESAIASLWEVNDAGTVSLMKAFYDRYRKGESRSEALRGAQLDLIKTGTELARPSIWAAFTLLGAWR